VSEPTRHAARVVSLVPSVTETLIALGVTPIACTRFCEQPSLPHVGGTKDPDLDAIVALRPDVVVMDDEENLREHHDVLVERGACVHVTHVRTIDDVAPVVASLASLVGRTHDVVVPPGTADTRCRAFVPIWRRPWMTINADTYGASILSRCGIDVVTADASQRYPTVELGGIVELAPDVVLLPTEPYPFKDRHAAEISDRLGVPARLVNGQDVFWWGVRTPDAITRLTAACRC
jgi:ABC-type Fe3+-hydroxamate transport system substrate-binding protein